MELPRLWLRATNTRLPTEQLRAITELRAELDRLELEAILTLRSWNVSWDDIGRMAGTSRQSVRRFLKRLGAGAPAPGPGPEHTP